MTDLWTPVTIGAMRLPHRLAMAPMTRDRALPDGTPSPSAVRYYAQRASLGLLITEGTQPSEDGQGYLLTPGVHTNAQVAGWRRIADAVHDAGAHLVIQLMHVGRMSHPDNTPHHRTPVAPSAIAPGVQMFTATGMRDIPVPRALDTDEVRATVADFRRAAARAIEAGADAVEIHGANGYLPHQFLAEGANHRTDGYGGSIENRARFTVEVAEAVVAEIGAERTGLRLSPGSPAGGINEGETGPETYRHLVRTLAPANLAYLHLLHLGDEDLLRDIRAVWPTALLVNRPGRDRVDLAADIDAGLADVATVAT
ncbi:MAG TPA: alkene reductase, partial [Pseudonocardiaceae bacterium]|nr:alkene reductase [Pseudonocardiaceae bacterium]